MTQHTIAKIQKAEAAAQAAGLMGEWVDITDWLNILRDIYGEPREKRPVRVRSIDGIIKVLKACYSD